MQFSDTDSCQYHFLGRDPELFELEKLHLFDTISYPTDHPCYSATNKKKLGTFADVYEGRPIARWVGLKAKLYSAVRQ